MLKKNEKGQSMVEFALVLPLLLLIVCGIIDFGWIFGNQLMADNAIREAARACAITSSLTQYELETLAEDTVSSRAGPLCSMCDVTVTVVKHTSTGQIDVSISCELPVLTPLTSTIIGPTYSLTAISVMRGE